MRLALRSKGVGRAYRRAAAAIFAITLVIDTAMIGGLFWLTTPAEDAAVWMIAALWIARVIGTVAALLIGPLLAIFAINIAFPLFNKGVFLAGLQLADPERAAALAAKPGMPLGPAAGIALRRMARFVLLSLGLLMLGLIPVIGSLAATVLQLWLTARTIAWELMDPYFDCLDIRYAEQREIVGRLHEPLLGFGVPVALLLAIPLIGPLSFGIMQAAAGVFVAREFPIDPREAA